MPRRRRLLAGMALGWAGIGGVAAAPLARGEAVSWPAIDLLDGRRLAAADWADTAAVVVFWATWCAYCRRHNARIEQLHRATAGQRLRVLTVVVDSNAAGVRRYLQANDLSFAVTLAAPGLREQFSTRQVVPLTATVDRRGRLLQVLPGEMAEADILGLAALAR